MALPPGCGGVGVWAVALATTRPCGEQDNAVGMCSGKVHGLDAAESVDGGEHDSVPTVLAARSGGIARAMLVARQSRAAKAHALQ